jgi:protein-disulfide isomerase
LGVVSTPTLFANDRMVTSAEPFEGLAQIIDDELARAGN